MNYQHMIASEISESMKKKYINVNGKQIFRIEVHALAKGLDQSGKIVIATNGNDDKLEVLFYRDMWAHGSGKHYLQFYPRTHGLDRERSRYPFELENPNMLKDLTSKICQMVDRLFFAHLCNHGLISSHLMSVSCSAISFSKTKYNYNNMRPIEMGRCWISK